MATCGEAGARLSLEGDSWLPTHSARSAEWMEHGAFWLTTNH